MADRKRFVKKHLKLMDKLSDHDDKSSFDNFVTQYLRSDGIFVLRLIGVNTDAVTVTEVICKLWAEYLTKQQEGDDEKPGGSDV